MAKTSKLKGTINKTTIARPLDGDCHEKEMYSDGMEVPFVLRSDISPKKKARTDEVIPDLPGQLWMFS